jgi:hypothetical protein
MDFIIKIAIFIIIKSVITYDLNLLTKLKDYFKYQFLLFMKNIYEVEIFQKNFMLFHLY